MKKILFTLLLIIPFIVFAECDSKVLISNLKLNEKKGFAEELEPASYECNNIKLNIKMFNKDDSISYNLTIKNNSDADVELNNSFGSKSEYIEYKIEDDNLIVEKGKEKTFKLVATYTKEVDIVLLSNGNINDDQVMNLSVTTKEKNPNTSSTNIILIVIIMLLSVLTVYLLIINKKQVAKYMSLLVLFVLVVPIIVYALTKFELKLEAKVVIAEPKMVARGPVCKKATTLHTSVCDRSDGQGCNTIIETGSTITYGTLVNGDVKAGDAYDCDVNNDGVYDSETERFYYLTNDKGKASLIYYSNMNDQTPYQYDSVNEGWHGPRVGYEVLPSTSEWSNPKIVAPGTRNILSDNDTNKVKNSKVEVEIESFTYTDKAARLLTIQEVRQVCGNGSVSLNNYLNACYYLLEKVSIYERKGSGISGYWLETPAYYAGDTVWHTYGTTPIITNTYPRNNSYYGVRPVITIRTTDIEGDIVEEVKVEEPVEEPIEEEIIEEEVIVEPACCAID